MPVPLPFSKTLGFCLYQGVILWHASNPHITSCVLLDDSLGVKHPPNTRKFATPNMRQFANRTSWALTSYNYTKDRGPNTPNTRQFANCTSWALTITPKLRVQITQIWESFLTIQDDLLPLEQSSRVMPNASNAGKIPNSMDINYPKV